MAARLSAVRADIVTLEVDALVNAANAALSGGGGVDGAIHRAAGPRLLEACRALGGCASGDAGITPGFDLPARSVIHAVGPVWSGGGSREDELLASCYARAVALAAEFGLASLAFSAISTGVFGFPPERAAPIAVDSVRRALPGWPGAREVIFCCFSERSRALHQAALDARAQ